LAELNRALALVRPVGMSDQVAGDWLTAAVAQTMPLTDGQFRRQVEHARNHARFHGEIVALMMTPRTMPDGSPSILDHALREKRAEQIATMRSQLPRNGSTPEIAAQKALAKKGLKNDY
jgi:hypothetical protein